MNGPPLVNACRNHEAAEVIEFPPSAGRLLPARTASRAGYGMLSALIAILCAGAFLRLYPSSGFAGAGGDETFYRLYVEVLSGSGLGAYPKLFNSYIEMQKMPDTALVLPPGRILFLASALGWHSFTGIGPLAAVRAVSCASSILLLVFAAAFAWRAGGATMALGVSALMAASPLDIHLAQRALIDGFFAMWVVLALWALWELFQRPEKGGWLAIYTLALAAMVLTKENAAFVAAAFGAVLGANLILPFGRNSLSLWVATAVGPILAVALLIFCAGGVETLVTAYRLNVAKSYLSPYVIETGDGPWFRYLIELMSMNPVVFLLAIAGLAHLRLSDKTAVFLGLFTAVTFVLMSASNTCFNLRYTIIWDLPIRWFAVSMLMVLGARWPARFRSAATSGGAWWCRAVRALRYEPARMRPIVFGGAVAIAAAVELSQYYYVFVAGAVYDPVPWNVLNALSILKGG